MLAFTRHCANQDKEGIHKMWNAKHSCTYSWVSRDTWRMFSGPGPRDSLGMRSNGLEALFCGGRPESVQQSNPQGCLVKACSKSPGSNGMKTGFGVPRWGVMLSRWGPMHLREG